MLTKDAIVEKYSNGQIEWKIPIEWFAVGRYRRHGESIQYYPTGEVKLRRSYDHGKQVGEEVMYYRDGSVMSRLPFKDGKVNGTYVVNHPDGTHEETDYVAGEATKVRKFDKNGKEKQKKDDQSDRGPATGPKKILPGDYVPTSLR